MKKKVLFALIALFSFVSAWAVDLVVVNDNGTVGYAVYNGNDGLVAENLAVKVGGDTYQGEAIYEADATTLVGTPITTVGNYFLKVDGSEKLYPFQVAVEAPTTSYEIIDGPGAWNASAGAANGGTGDGKGLKLYYAATDDPAGWSPQNQNASKPYWEDMWCYETNRVPSVWNDPRDANEGILVDANADNSANRGDGYWYQVDQNGFWVLNGAVRCWGGAIKANIPQELKNAGYKSKFPWIVFDFEGDETGASYKPVLEYTDDDVLIATPWANGKFGNGEGLRLWGVASIPVEFGKPNWSMNPNNWYSISDADPNDPNSQTIVWLSEGDNFSDFDKQELRVLLFPAEAPNTDILFDYSWTMTPTVVAYNAQAQDPTITVTAKNINGETVTVPRTNATDNSVNWTVKYFNDAACAAANEVTSMVNKGTYYVQVYLPGADAPVALGTAKQFEITAFQLTLGASVSYKQLGDPDPAPAYSLLYDNAPESVKAEAAKLKITGLKLTRSYPETDTEATDYVGKQIRCFIEMIDAAVQDENGQPNANYQVGTSSVDTWLVITQKLLRDGEFRAVVLDDIFTYDGTEKKPTNIKVQQDMNYDKEGADPDWQDVLPSDVLGSVAKNFTITYANNIAADAYGIAVNEETDPTKPAKMVNQWMADVTPATVILTPKADGNYTSRLNLGNNEFLDGEPNIEEPFKIKQANIADATVTLTIPEDGLIFNNAEQKPAVKVEFNSMTLAGAEAGAAAVENQAYVYSYSGNKYVDDNAKATVEAVYTGSGVEKVYTGNYFGTKDATFTIGKFVFTLKPVSHIVAMGDDEQGYDAANGFAVEGVPAVEGAEMPQDVADIATWTKPVNRIAGTSVGVYPILLKGAALKSEASVTGIAKSAPTNNYVMTAENGTYEITKAEGVFFVSSKKIDKVYDGEATIASTATPGYYLYKKTGEGNRKADYTEIQPESNLFKMIVGPTKHVARPMAQGENFNSDGDRVPGRDVRSNPAYSWWIMPVVDDLSTDDYTLQVMPRLYSDNTSGNNYNQHEGEGFCQISPRDVVLVADNQKSEFNEAIVTPLTATAYDKSTAANADANGLVKNDAGVIQNAPLSETLAAQIPYVLQARYNNRNLQQGDAVGEYTIRFTNNQPAVSSNFNVTRVNGVYTITESSKRIKLTATGTKVFGETDERAAWTVTAVLGKGDEFAEYTGQLPTVLSQATSYKRASATDTDESAGSTHDMDFVQKTGAAPNETVVCPAKINGYIVDYDNSTAVLTINKAGELILTAANQFIEYGMLPQVGENVSAPYLKINGHKNDLDKIKATVVITYPESGLIKNGAPITITYDEAYVDANYTSVTVNGATLRVTAVDEITLNRAPKADVIDAEGNYVYAKSYADIVADNGPANNALQLIKDYAGVEGVKVNFTPSIAMVKEKWYAMVLPFETTVKEISDAFGYAVVETLDKNSNDIHFKIQMQKIPANTPFIVKIYDAKDLKDIAFNGKTIVYTETPVAFNKDNSVAFYGTYIGKYCFTDKEYFFSMGTTSDPEKYYYGGVNPKTGEPNTTFLRPLGSYIADLSESLAGTRVIYIDEPDGTTTAIEGVAVEGADSNAVEGFAEGWYTITGVKLDAEPTTTGTYIFNGKKVFIQK